jgi:hypothetical protein
MRMTIVLLALVGTMLDAAPRQAPGGSPKAAGATYVVYYWRAKPGQADAYSDYIRTTAEPIDMDAQKAGAFEEVHTVMPAAGLAADWTHLRMFRVKDAAAAQALGAALDAATARVVPDETQRKTNSTRAASLRDFVRQEIWTELR